ncbi:PAS domain S-box-containing protein [Roseimicrobium gellanilyticum]|uniref:histidine kinase n=1 Tax=Roseimicrobium gellanilyticum TaxID=748857 RepID=A0A366HNA6_9BACT|nr:ATP-binding protein [Roseimicrobium gellanilyticum]RBP44639.1 PAS domain S-box-containing protein [Roseimicrobium gellanilyticum]
MISLPGHDGQSHDSTVGRDADAVLDQYPEVERRILLCAPTGSDGRTAAKLLTGAGHEVMVCTSMVEVGVQIARGCSAVVLAEEALGTMTVPTFLEVLHQQPSWSDLPVIIVGGRGEAVQWRLRRMANLGLGGNVSLLERPFHPETLISTVEVAMRARSRQYQVRTLLQEQKESELRLHNIFQSISEPFAVLDQAWRFTYVNRGFMALVPRGRRGIASLLGHVLWEQFPKLEETELGKFLQHVSATQVPGVLEFEYEAARMWLEVRAYPSREMLALHVRDITERKQAAEQLRRRSERMQLLSELLAQLIGAADSQTVVRDLFPKVAKNLDVDTYFNFMLAESGDHLVLHSCRGVSQEVQDSIQTLPLGTAICGTVALLRQPIIATDIQHSTDPKADLVRGLGIQAYACHPLMVGGRLLGTLSFASHTRPAFDEEEIEFLRLITQYAAIALDRLKTTEAMEKNAQQLGVALGAAQLGTWNWDAQTDAMTISERTGEIYGLNAGTYPSRSVLRGLLHPDDRELAKSSAQRSVETGCDYDIEYRVRLPQGGYRWVAAKGRCVFHLDGSLAGMLGVAQDITASKVAEARLRESAAAAESANRSKDLFLAVLSHELRTPLTPVLLAADTMEHDAELPAAFKADIAMIRRNVELEAKIIDDLLDISRITSGKLNLNLESVDVNDSIRQVCAMCTAQITERSIQVRCDFADEPGTVRADSARLQQVLWNLLNNAVKFTPEGGTINIRTERLDGHLRIQVQDSGMGIDQELLPQIFNAFEQGDIRITRQFGGLGLGLAITKALVDMHHGTIAAESDGKGTGACFTVTLPLETEVRAPASHSPSAQQPGRPVSLHLLVVEDHADTARVLGTHLRRMGFTVTLAHTVADALALVGEQHFDLVISDLGLPDQSGFELMRQIHAIRPIPGIAMSGYGMAEDIRKSREAGFSQHLVKPVNVTRLEEAIRDLVDGK